MSHKIADFTNTHKLSYVKNGIEKYASALKIGNTNEIGWYEQTTPTNLENLSTHLDFNDFHPNKKNTCKRTKRDWTTFAWGGNYVNDTNFNINSEDLHSDHAPLTNRKINRCFGNNSENKMEKTSFKDYFFSHSKNCEINIKNLPHLGEKYNVSFWIKIKNPSKYDCFSFYQNNSDQNWIHDNDLTWRWIYNLATNNLEFIVNPIGSDKEVDAYVIQTSRDFRDIYFNKYWYGGVAQRLPVNKWIFVNVSLDGHYIKVFFNKEIASTNQFKYTDVIQHDSTILKKGGYDESSNEFGRNYNFNDCTTDGSRMHGLGIYSNSILVSDFRTYSNVAPQKYNDPFLSHLQNHRDQIGDLPLHDTYDVSRLIQIKNLKTKNNFHSEGYTKIDPELYNKLEDYVNAYLVGEHSVLIKKELNEMYDINLDDLERIIQSKINGTHKPDFKNIV